MTKNIAKNRPFLNLLLSTTKLQQEAIVLTLTNEQVNFLSEIVKNLINLETPSKTSKLLNKNLKLFQRFTIKKYSASQRKKVFQKHFNIFLSLFLSVKTQLLQL